jgi:thiol-disulfide isomerase/thioredoxin
MKYFYSTVLALGLALMASAQAPILNYDFTFKITNLSDSTDSVAYMANYYGNKQYYFDTAVFEPGGVLHFKGDTIKGGIYSIILSDKKNYFEFSVNEPKIVMETKAGDFVKSMKVTTSEENKSFYEYLAFIEDESKKAEALKKKLDAAEEKDKKKIEEQLGEVDKEVMAYKKTFIASHPDLFVSKVFSASAEPEIPEFTEIKDEDERQRARYKAFKNAYLAGVDFTDERLLRTPIMHNKLNYYITKLVAQSPDSIIKEADALVERAKPNKEVHKYVIHYITNKYEDSKIMGMDAVLVHMGQKYYCAGECWWLSKKKLDEFCERVNKMAPILIGKQAPNLILMDTSGIWQELYAQKTKFTILYFWDSGCGHCKKVTPKLVEFYNEYKDKGITVYAVGTEFENKDWKKYLKKNKLPFINVSDSPEINKNAQDLMLKKVTTLESLNFRDTYDIFSTPKLFLLDENKKIIATKLMPEQLGEFVDHLIQQDKEAGEKKESKEKAK